MKKRFSYVVLSGIALVCCFFFFNAMCADNHAGRAVAAQKRVVPLLTEFLKPCGAKVGSPVFLRAVKEDSLLEMWVKPDTGDRYILVKKYPIAAWSGELGPKQKQGDLQTPEGFYEVAPGALNPYSNYHLSFNIGYPNAHDRSLNRTGSLIMVHGSDVSIGCLAMTDRGIEEIYTMVAQALEHGQKSVPVQIYPFVPTPARLVQEKDSPYAAFWSELAEAWKWTEDHHAPARVKSVHGKLIVAE